MTTLETSITIEITVTCDPPSRTTRYQKLMRQYTRSTKSKYALVTPVRNEAAHIERTLLSVVGQTVKPARWIIVDDGSVDTTSAIVRAYATAHPFISLLSTGPAVERNFSAKARAVMIGYSRLQAECVDFDFVGNVDADVSFRPEYFESILRRFEDDPTLGLAGGILVEVRDSQWTPLYQASNSVAGVCQLFRRTAFDQIEGYRELPYGGIDTCAEVEARVQGWRVMSFADQVVYHHRATGSALNGVWRARFRGGQRDQSLGYHPLFFALKALNSGMEGKGLACLWSIASTAGYASALFTQPSPRPPLAVRTALRTEQRARLAAIVKDRSDLVARHRIKPSTVLPAPYGPDLKAQEIDHTSRRRDGTAPRCLAILGGGGHTTEMLALVEYLGSDFDYWYIMSKLDPLSDVKVRRPGRVVKIKHPRGTEVSKLSFAWHTLRNAPQILWILLSFRPDIIVSTGPSIALIPLLLGKITGARTVFVETGCRVAIPSASARTAHRFVDTIYVQWRALKLALPKAIYRGRLL